MRSMLFLLIVLTASFPHWLVFAGKPNGDQPFWDPYFDQCDLPNCTKVGKFKTVLLDQCQARLGSFSEGRGGLPGTPQLWVLGLSLLEPQN